MLESEENKEKALPFLSIILPCVESAEKELLWTLRSYEIQSIDPQFFEIVIVEDGKPSDAVRNLALKSWSFKVRYFNSPRIQEPQLAHKNHARNTGWRWAGGKVCFICDCDCLVNRMFVERAMDLYKEVEQKGEPFVLYPMIACLKQSVEKWAGNEEESWTKALKNLPFATECSSHSFGGYYQAKQMEKGGIELLKEHPEGYPMLSRHIFRIIGGFDEDFLGWGGNKQEFQQRIMDSGVIKQYLMHGCAVFHQPHGKEAGNKNTRGNYGLMKEKRIHRKKEGNWKSRITLLLQSRCSEPSNPVLNQWSREAADFFSSQFPEQRIERFILKEEPARKDRRILFIGPWVGEFGWEVCRWQGGVRKLVYEKYKNHYIIVAGDRGHHALYEYAHEYWAIPEFVYCEKLTRETLRLLPEDRAKKVQVRFRGMLAKELAGISEDIDMILPRRFLPSEQMNPKLMASVAAREECEYLLQGSAFRKWVCIFPRKRSLNAQKNWPEANWMRLMKTIVERFQYGIILMGREEDTASLSYDKEWFINTAILQPERRMDVNIAFLNQALASIGSESGGPFLSLLSGCPTLVMGGMDYKKRYENEENFLKTRCVFLAKKGYCHGYEEVEREAMQFLESLEDKTNPEILLANKEISKTAYEKAGKRSYDEQYKIMQQEFGYEYNKRDKAIANKLLFGQHPEEFQKLDHFLEDYSQSKELKCLVELGVHTGASTWMLSRHLEEKSLIIGVDCGLFPGLKYSQQVYTKLSQEGFICHFLEETTENALNKVKFLSIQGIDILHLDANESYENVKKDWQNYAPLMNPGGIVLIHDIEYIPGIKTFWNEIKVSKKFQEIRNGGQGMGIIVLP